MDIRCSGPVPPEAHPVNDEGYEPIEYHIFLSSKAAALSPDGFIWWLDATLKDARKDILNAYYRQRA